MKKIQNTLAAAAMISGIILAGAEAGTLSGQIVVCLAGLALCVAGGLAVCWINRTENYRPDWVINETLDRR
jgi:uncharacterized iron-regulated membrane protein